MVKEQISISLLSALRDDAGWLCGDKSPVFQHPHILVRCVGAHSGSLPDGFETGPTLISTPVLAVYRKHPTHTAPKPSAEQERPYHRTPDSCQECSSDQAFSQQCPCST